MQHSNILLVLVASATGLTACSGGSSTGSSAVYSVPDGTAAEALEAGRTLTATQESAAAITRDFDAETAMATADPSASVRKNAAGGLDLTVAGRTISFSPADTRADGYGYEIAGASIWTWSTESMAEAIDPAVPGYVRVFDYHTDLEPGGEQSGFIVTGTETRPAALAALPTATYFGRARVRVAPTEGFADWNDSVSEARGDMALTANFGAGTVSGGITNLDSRAPRNVDPTRTWTPFAGSVALGSAPITGNSFTGAVTADAAFQSTIGTIDAGSTYSGRFYGPEAQQAAGVFNLTGTPAGGGTMIGWGQFQTGR